MSIVDPNVADVRHWSLNSQGIFLVIFFIVCWFIIQIRYRMKFTFDVFQLLLMF